VLVVYACVAALVLVVIAGGDIRALGRIRIRHVYLVWVALAVQVIVLSFIPDTHPRLLAAAHIATYVAAGACLVLNRRLPGIWLIATGAMLNGTVIALNGGTLPASASALRAAGWHPSAHRFHNSALIAHPRLSMFGDVFATPRWLPGHNVFSLGDVIICLGVLYLLWRTCRRTQSGPARRWRSAGSPVTSWPANPVQGPGSDRSPANGATASRARSHSARHR
jgi:hypothetical protein